MASEGNLKSVEYLMGFWSKIEEVNINHMLIY
jgi:hypothetical protein